LILSDLQKRYSALLYQDENLESQFEENAAFKSPLGWTDTDKKATKGWTSYRECIPYLMYYPTLTFTLRG
jgi:hypothetical protein